MKKIVTSLSLILLMSLNIIYAQTINPYQSYRFGGLALNQDIMMAWDFSELSRMQNFGTARVMGMGGAFVSLGADLTSMSLNPAGLGMYRRSEFAITPLVAVSHAETANTASWASNNKGRFTVGNIGAAINVYENASKGVTSITFGMGLNRIADFNTRYSYSSEAEFNGTPVASIADIFAGMFNRGEGGQIIYPQPQPDGNPNGRLDYANPYFWPAVLGYKNAMTHVNPTSGSWERDAIGNNASIRRSVDVQNVGSINEFDVSFGMNINNLVYVGATLGIQSVHKRSDVVYGEDYGYFDNPEGLAYGPDGKLRPAQLGYADLWQRTELDGSGFNFKLGVVVRPTKGLRLGMAFHTPTFYSLERSYRAGTDYRLLSNEDSPSFEDRIESPIQYDEDGNSWEFISPSRLMFGASYTFGKYAVVSVDYERDWYNGIRVKNTPRGIDFSKEDYKLDFKENFCGTNSIRAGIEVKPLPIFALRAGGGYTSSMLRDEELAYEFPQSTTSYYFTAGAGVNITKNIVFDLAYQYLSQQQSQYRLFYSYDQAVGDFVAESGLYDTSLTRHFISMTIGFRF